MIAFLTLGEGPYGFSLELNFITEPDCFIEFVLIFFSVILIAIFFAVIGSYFIIENIFQLVWQLDLKILFKISGSIGLVTLVLIMLTNLKYLNPKVYPLIRNQ